MVEIKNIKIAKKMYQFELRRKYQHAKNYRIKKKSEIDKINEKIATLFKGSSKKDKKSIFVEEKPGKKFNPIIIAVAIFVALLIIFGGWFYFIVLPQTKVVEKPKEPIKIAFSTALLDNGIITAGDRRSEENIGYARLRFSISGIKNYSVKLTTYAETIPRELYVFLSEREEADGYDEFIATLRKELQKEKIVINEIDIDRLETLPIGATIIVPSGTMPKELLGVESKTDLNKLLSKGAVIIYVGQRFALQTPLKDLPIAFDSTTTLQSENNFHLFQPLYEAKANAPGIENFLIYGSVSVMKKGDGALIFVPQTIDGGWRNEEGRSAPEIGGKDIANLILETKWATKEGEENIYAINTVNETSPTTDFFTNTFKGDKKTIKINIVAMTENNSTMQETKLVHAEKLANGSLFIDRGYTVTPREVTGEYTRMNAIIADNNSQRKSLFLEIRENGKKITDSEFVGTRTLPAEISSIDTPIDLDSGEYIANIVDEEGSVYAQSYLRVAFINIKWRRDASSAGKYVFYVEREGTELKDPLRKISVKVDNKYGPYEFSNVKIISVDLSKDVERGDLPPGPHAFTFSIGKIDKKVTIIKPDSAPPLIRDPLFFGTIIFAALVLAIGVFFAQQGKMLYQIDIPDFPPVAKTNVPLKKEVILDLFNKVNQDYRWKYTPLTPAELKGGFKKMFYQGRPLYVTDYNIEYLLEKLEVNGDVKGYLEYFGPTIWEQQAKKTMPYLSMFRKIRDICVNYAAPFTLLGESQDCDTEITLLGQVMYASLYEKESAAQVVKKALKTITKGITLIVFKDEHAKSEFISLLASSSKAMLTLKMEVENGSVLLLTPTELEAKLKEYKGF